MKVLYLVPSYSFANFCTWDSTDNLQFQVGLNRLMMMLTGRATKWSPYTNGDSVENIRGYREVLKSCKSMHIANLQTKWMLCHFMLKLQKVLNLKFYQTLFWYKHGSLLIRLKRLYQIPPCFLIVLQTASVTPWWLIVL